MTMTKREIKQRFRSMLVVAENPDLEGPQTLQLVLNTATAAKSKILSLRNTSR